MSAAVARAARVIDEHSYDYDIGECMCGHAGEHLEHHVAEELAKAGLLADTPPAPCCEPVNEVGRWDG